MISSIFLYRCLVTSSLQSLGPALGIPLLVIELTTLDIAAMVKKESFMDDLAKVAGKKSVEANLALKRTKV